MPPSVVVVAPFDPLGRWYGQAGDLCEKLLKVLEIIDDGPAEKRDPVEDWLANPVESTRHVVVLVRLVVKLCYVVLLAAWACAYVVWKKITLAGGFR